MAEPTQAEINRVVNGFNLVDGAADYADSIVCEMQQISGENHRMIWTTENSGRFEPNK